MRLLLTNLDSVVHDQILRKVKHIPSTDADLIDEHVFQVWTGHWILAGYPALRLWRDLAEHL